MPELWTNLFSIGSLLKTHWNLLNDGPIISLSKNNFRFSFDQLFLTKDDLIMSINIKSSSGASIERNGFSPFKEGTLIYINVLHGILGHASEYVVRKTVKYYGWKLLGTLKKCEDCSLTKAKCKNMSNYNGPKFTIPGERICFDISVYKKKSMEVLSSGYCYWINVLT